MARIRTIKPEFWKHEELSALAADTHMLAAALLNYADDEGYFNANEKLIQSECCPLRELSVSVHDSLIELSNMGYIEIRADDSGKRFGRVVKFTEHQRVNRPTPSKYKDLFNSLSPHRTFTEPSPPDRKGREQGTGNGKESVPNGTGASAPMDDDALFYHEGKAILGKQSGGYLTKLKLACGGATPALEVLRHAKTRDSPAEYIGAVIRERSKPDLAAELTRALASV